MSVKVFTIDEVNQLLPLVDRYLNQLRDLREQIVAKQVEVDLQEIVGGDDSEGSQRQGGGAGARVAKELTELGVLAGEFNEVVEQFEAVGCYLKDLDQGLVDFYHSRNGELVWLCWKQGEASIAHWHELENGFASRKSLDDRQG